ncbi:MAG TPA: Na+:solute symporter, partial [Bacteroidia bacterium]|nr:Na+:solute symporter [Bacteroidia bacterium]
MHLHVIDWIIIFAFLGISFFIGFYYKNQSSKSLSDYFLGGRQLPWYLAGISMVATTFAADTPLAVTELVGQKGIAGNWLWWNFLLGGMLTTFFFARLWYKANVLTEIELIEFRYSGKHAAILRGFKALYLGLFMNCLIIGWVNVALAEILKVYFNLEHTEAFLCVGGFMVLTMIYSSLGGLKGIAVTDVFQFTIAMLGCIILAVIVLNSDKIGGITGLKSKLPKETFNFFPEFGNTSHNGVFVIGIGAFLAHIAVQWWASWYPGSEPGGGGYVAQRMMSTRNEKESVYATLLFQIAHYCLRPWPWIIIALCSLVLYPELTTENKKAGFVMTMKDFLPAGLQGLLLVAFFAAYMSTISTQLNWGASYLVNDLVKRFGKNTKENDEKLMVRYGR